MANQKMVNKFRNYMYEQQVKYLPNGMMPEEYYEYIEKKLKPKRMAMILHDKDMKDDNRTPIEEHIHIMLQLENARSLNPVAKAIGDSPERLQIWRNSIENGFSYLIHATTNARYKHQYSCEEVKANFDYSAYIESISKKVNKIEVITSANKISALLDLLATGEITVMEVKQKLTGSEYAKASDKIKKAHELFLDRSAEILHNEMYENEEMLNVHWFYGKTETGKSFLAEKLAKEMGAYYKTTTTTDPFQFYQAEHTIILDELRPEVIPYSELLALLNPFSQGKIAVSSRYFNKNISCRTIFITTPYDPITFYQSYHLRSSDKGDQLYRRLSSVLRFDMNYIYKMEYQNDFGIYTEGERKENQYSRKKQKQYVLDNIFDRID